MKRISEIDVDKVANAIENDAGHTLPGLRESLRQARSNAYSKIHTPEQIVERRSLTGDRERMQDEES